VQGDPISRASTPPFDRSKAFTAIAISFVAMVFSMSMVFVALSAIADDFGVTLRAASWVVIVQSLVISALMMPLGRVADMVGRRKVHLIGLVLFGIGSLAVALAPTFPLMIAARAVMSLGNAMGQAVGTAMIVAIFPPEERGKALGSQTTIVALGTAAGPIGGGLVLQALPWEALFLLLLPPIAIAYVVGVRYLDEAVVSASGAAGGPAGRERPGFDWGGAALSALAITAMVLTVSNPFALAWTSPAVLAGFGAMAVVLTAFAWWELRHPAPMLELRFFARRLFTLAVTARTLGFVGYTSVIFLVPIYLISVRGLGEGAAGAVLFLASLGMGVAGNRAGPLSDRLGERPVAAVGFAVHVVSLGGFVFVGRSSPLWLVMLLLLGCGLALGLWNVPNGSTILGSVPPENLGVVGAFMNLTRNIGSVIGQALAAAVVVGIMGARGFDIPLSELESTAGAASAFLDGWRVTFLLFTAVAAVALVVSLAARPTTAARRGVPVPAGAR
jgi:MFS family permease